MKTFPRGPVATYCCTLVNFYMDLLYLLKNEIILQTFEKNNSADFWKKL